jgi:hypothetical protein
MSSRVGLIIKRGMNCIYWPLIHNTRKYKLISALHNSVLQTLVSPLRCWTFNSHLNPVDSSIICQLPTLELSTQFPAATTISSHISSQSSTLDCQFCQSYVTTDGQSASLSWNKAPICGLRPALYYCQTVEGLLIWCVLYNERTSRSFTMYNVQYIYILHVILSYSFTNRLHPTLSHNVWVLFYDRRSVGQSFLE